MDLSQYPLLSKLLLSRKEQENNQNTELFALSDFVYSQYSRHCEWSSFEFDSSTLKSNIKKSNTIQQLKTNLRLYRNNRISALIKKQFTDVEYTSEVMLGCSELAEDCINSALSWLQADFCKRFGTPKNASGEVQSLVVIAMGKLGGRELNLSSDIDLIFTYPESGLTAGTARSLENSVFFNRLVQQLVGVLTEVTQDGFVFRVDTRLRPFGDSGPLVTNFDSIAEYYLEQGRGWERFAMIKARPVTGTEKHKSSLMKILNPFIYRRYIDFSMLETPRKIKQQIEAELRRRNLGENLKLGPGGIREIEFIVQAMQLIHGGKLRSLQLTSTLECLEQLVEHQLLERNEVKQLTKSYLLLRFWEHCLQGFADRQTQTLPTDDLNQQRLCFLAGKKCWRDWMLMLDEIRKPVHKIFLAQFSNSDREQRLQNIDELQDLWLVPEDATDNLKLLDELGFLDSASILKQIIQFKKRISEKNIAASSRSESLIAKLVPEIIRLCSSIENSSSSIERMFALMEAVQTRTAYLDLFVENKNTLRLLTDLFSRSPWIAEHTQQYPLVLDDLLNPNWLKGEEIDDCGNNLLQQISRIADDDEEQLLDIFREFKQSSYFQLAACFAMETITMKQLGIHLSNVAKVLLQQAYLLAKKKVESRYGKLINKDGNEAEFIVVAMGKLGSQEMGFSSDLDLVFIHDANDVISTGSKRQLDGMQYFSKLAQRLIHALSIRMSSGILYDIDTRLRPSGNSGYLVSSMLEYKQYQLTQAWTWEHQSLTRARVICGSEKLSKKFKQTRLEVLSKDRNKQELLKDIKQMRLKMKQNLLTQKNHQWDFKQNDGGLTDIEFLIQYLLLLNANSCQALCLETQITHQLSVLAQNEIITTEQAAILQKIYISYLERHNRQTLLQHSILADKKFKVQAQQVIEILKIYQLWPWKLQ